MTAKQNLTKAHRRENRLHRIYPLFDARVSLVVALPPKIHFAITHFARTSLNMECKAATLELNFLILSPMAAALGSSHSITLLAQPDDNPPHLAAPYTFSHCASIGLARWITLPRLMPCTPKISLLAVGTFTHSGRAFSSGCSHPPTHSRCD